MPRWAVGVPTRHPRIRRLCPYVERMPLPSRATVASRKANAMKTREAPSVKKKDAAAAQGALVAVEGVTEQRVPSSGFELMVRLRVGHATRGAASRAPSSAAEWLRCEGSGAKFADLAAVVSARARRQRAGHSNDVFYGGVGRCGDWDALVVAYDPSRRLVIRIATLEEGEGAVGVDLHPNVHGILVCVG